MRVCRLTSLAVLLLLLLLLLCPLLQPLPLLGALEQAVDAGASCRCSSSRLLLLPLLAGALRGARLLLPLLLLLAASAAVTAPASRGSTCISISCCSCLGNQESGDGAAVGCGQVCKVCGGNGQPATGQRLAGAPAKGWGGCGGLWWGGAGARALGKARDSGSGVGGEQ